MDWRDVYYRTHHIVQGICFSCRPGKNMSIKELYIHSLGAALPARITIVSECLLPKKVILSCHLPVSHIFSHSAPHITPIRHIRFGRPHTLHFRFAGNIFFQAQYLEIAFNSPSEICRPSFHSTTLSTPSSTNPKKFVGRSA